MKLKVLECSTGKDKVEEWTFLPADWDHELVRRPKFDKNFAFLDFETRGKFEFTDTGDILILNMITRKKFWMRMETLIAQIKEKTARIDFEEFRGRTANARQMNVKKDGIVVNYEIQSGRGSTLGWFSNSYIYLGALYSAYRRLGI